MRFYAECAAILLASCLIGIAAIAIDRALERPMKIAPDIVYPVHVYDGVNDSAPFIL